MGQAMGVNVLSRLETPTSPPGQKKSRGLGDYSSTAQQRLGINCQTGHSVPKKTGIAENGRITNG